MQERIVAVVTGATRGLGRGIARGLGSKGATVYMTGRAADGSLQQAAAEVDACGGRGIPVGCDHRQDEQVREVFERIRKDSATPDILVNNAAAVYPEALLAPGGFLGKAAAAGRHDRRRLAIQLCRQPFRGAIDGRSQTRPDRAPTR